MTSLEFNGLHFADHTAEEVSVAINCAKAVLCHVRLRDTFGPDVYAVTVFLDSAHQINVASVNTTSGTSGIAFAPDDITAMRTVTEMLKPEHGYLVAITPNDIPRISGE